MGVPPPAAWPARRLLRTRTFTPSSPLDAPKQSPSCARMGAPLLTLGKTNVLMSLASLDPGSLRIRCESDTLRSTTKAFFDHLPWRERLPLAPGRPPTPPFRFLFCSSPHPGIPWPKISGAPLSPFSPEKSLTNAKSDKTPPISFLRGEI